MSDPIENHVVKQQKYRAQRIDHDYHKKPHPWRGWLRVLTFTLPILAIVALAAVTVLAMLHVWKPGNVIYEPGPVSNRHTFFNDRCQDCHETKNDRFGVVSNGKCLKCHDGPIHDTNQKCPAGEKVDLREVVNTSGTKIKVEEPRCASCHTEHKGSQQLVQMHDNHCTQCHSDLKLADGSKPTVASTKVVSFEEGHPDWANLKDTTPLYFNHKKHLEKTLYDAQSKYGPRQMQCMDCHATSNSNLEMMTEDSGHFTELKDFLQNNLKPEEWKTYFEDLIVRAQTTGVTKYKMTKADIERLAVETLDKSVVNDRMNNTGRDVLKIKLVFESALMDTVRERLGNSAAMGQNRYMLPISYERNCSSACHMHSIEPVDIGKDDKGSAILITPPHGTAANARKFLRDALYPQVVQGALSRTSMSPDEKAKMTMIGALRGNLAKGLTMPASKSEQDKMIVGVIKSKDNREKLFDMAKASLGGEEGMIKLLVPDVREKHITGYAKLSDKTKDEFLDKLTDALEGLVKSYVDDKPMDGKAIDALVDDKLNLALGTLFDKNPELRNLKQNSGKCIFCHEGSKDIKETGVKPENDEIVADIHIPDRWLNHAVFNHETHRVINCESCHDKARGSEKTSDVLLPTLQSCQKCHKPSGTRTDCIECHTYHDKQHQLQDRFVDIDGLINKGASAVEKLKMEKPKPKPEGADGLPPPDGQQKLPPPDGQKLPPPDGKKLPPPDGQKLPKPEEKPTGKPDEKPATK